MSLTTETWWTREYTPSALVNFGNRLKSHYGVPVYYKGDTNHLRGRHRSRNWVLNSAYCTNRSYGASDSRDLTGPGDAIRAADVMINGTTLQTVCKRLDAAVRAGQLPELAEWFGTKNGTSVTGWFEGHESSSDSSHLYHLHLGIWTSQVENTAFYNRLFNILTTGEDMPTADEIAKAVWTHTIVGWGENPQTYSANGSQLDTVLAARNLNEVSVPALTAKVDALIAAVAAIAAGGTSVDTQVVIDAVNAVGDRVIADLDARDERLAAALDPPA